MSKKDKPKHVTVTSMGKKVRARIDATQHKSADEAMLDAMLGKPKTDDDEKTDEKK